MRVAVLLGLTLLASCRDEGVIVDDATADAAVDAPIDASAAAADAAAVDAVIDAPTDAPTDAATDAPPDAATPPDAPLDAAIDAPLDAATDAGIPFTSPRIDTAFAGHCGVGGRGVFVRPMEVRLDGSALTDIYWQLSGTTTLQVCHADGTATGVGIGQVWDRRLLSDGRIVVRVSSPSPAQVYAPDLTHLGALTGSGLFSDAFDLAGVIYLTLAGSSSGWDATTFVPLGPVVAPVRPLAHCSMNKVLVTTPAGVRRFDVPTSTFDAAYPAVPVSAAAGTKVLVDTDCALVIVDGEQGPAGRAVTVHDVDGQLTATSQLAVTGETAMHLDHRGGLILSFPTTAAVDLRLARFDLGAGTLDPAFGVGGRADLDLPGVDWFDGQGSFSHFDVRSVGADAAGNLAIFVDHVACSPAPVGCFSGASYARVLVDP